MGAWPTMALKLPRVLSRAVGVVSLPASSAPAAGSAATHATTHREIIETRDPFGGMMYFTDRGIEELTERRGEEQVSLAWLAERLRDFVDLNPGFDVAGGPAGQLARPARRRRGLDQGLFPERPGDRPGATRSRSSPDPLPASRDTS